MPSRSLPSRSSSAPRITGRARALSSAPGGVGPRVDDFAVAAEPPWRGPRPRRRERRQPRRGPSGPARTPGGSTLLDTTVDPAHPDARTGARRESSTCATFRRFRDAPGSRSASSTGPIRAAPTRPRSGLDGPLRPPQARPPTSTGRHRLPRDLDERLLRGGWRRHLPTVRLQRRRSHQRWRLGGRAPCIASGAPALDRSAADTHDRPGGPGQPVRRPPPAASGRRRTSRRSTSSGDLTVARRRPLRDAGVRRWPLDRRPMPTTHEPAGDRRRRRPAAARRCSPSRPAPPVELSARVAGPAGTEAVDAPRSHDPRAPGEDRGGDHVRAPAPRRPEPRCAPTAPRPRR